MGTELLGAEGTGAMEAGICQSLVAGSRSPVMMILLSRVTVTVAASNKTRQP